MVLQRRCPFSNDGRASTGMGCGWYAFMRTSDNMDTSDRIDRRTTTNVDILPNPRTSNEHRRHERCNCIRSPQPDGRAWRGRCGSGSSGVVPFRSLIDSSSPACTLSQIVKSFDAICCCMVAGTASQANIRNGIADHIMCSDAIQPDVFFCSSLIGLSNGHSRGLCVQQWDGSRGCTKRYEYVACIQCSMAWPL